MEVFDPEDVTWADPTIESDDENVDVKDVELQPKTVATRRRAVFGQQGDVEEMEVSCIALRLSHDCARQLTDRLRTQPPRAYSKHWNEKQLADWKRDQGGRLMNSTTIKGTNSVTGHGAKSGQSTKSVSQQAREGGDKRKVVAKAPSMLASITDKHSRFE
jgi:hypothetical protein